MREDGGRGKVTEVEASVVSATGTHTHREREREPGQIIGITSTRLLIHTGKDVVVTTSWRNLFDGCVVAGIARRLLLMEGRLLRGLVHGRFRLFRLFDGKEGGERECW